MNRLLMDLSIGRRLLLGFALVLLVAVLAVGVSINRLKAVADASRELLDDPLTTERLVSDWYRVIHSGIRRSLAIAKNNDSTLAVYFADEVKQGTVEAAELQKRIEPHMDSEKERAQWANLQVMRKEYLGLRDEAIALKKAGQAERASALIDQKFTPIANRYGDGIQTLLREERSQIDQMAGQIQDTYQQGRDLMWTLCVLMVLFVGACAWMLTLSITRPLADAVQVARRVANGDLTVRASRNSRDETGQLLDALNGMMHNLAALVKEVRNATSTISVAAGEIADGNADLSRRTETQASSLEETSSSMEELTGTVQQNADNASQASTFVTSATGVAEKGGAMVDEVVTTMSGIKDGARKIEEIIGVIDGIAFQTNILALNAAVEAARAGEQGRGFAVVATEVRNLAHRSAAAAKEIKTLILDSGQRVDRGVKLVDDAGATMREIVVNVRRIAGFMNDITGASREQSAGIAQVNTAVVQMDRMTQENAALVEQAAAAAESMKQQAAELARAVSAFKLDDESGARPARRSLIS